MDVSKIRSMLGAHLSRLRVAVYASGGAPSHHLVLLALWGGNPEVIYADEIVSGKLSEYDAVIFPGGGLAAMAGQLEPLGEAGMTALRRWVEAGGTYLGSCAGSCHPLQMSDAYNEAYPDASPFQICSVTPLNAAAGAWGLESPGTGRLRVMPEAHPLFEGLTDPFEIVHYNGPLFPPSAGAAGKVLGSANAFTPFEVSQGSYSEKQPTTLKRATSQGARVAYQQHFGNGRVIVFGSHPEFGGSALQLGWLPGARLLANALGCVPAKSTPLVPTTDVLAKPVFLEIRRRAAELKTLFARAAPLRECLPTETPSFLGMSGLELWDAVIAEAQELLDGLEHWAVACPSGNTVRGVHLLDCAPKPGQDVGFMGTCQLLDHALELAQRAVDPTTEWPDFTGAYDQLETHPYHLLVGSYLSAGGLIAAAALQVTAFTALNALPQPYSVPLGDFHAKQTLQRL